MCEGSIVTGQILDRAIIQGKGISPDADAVGVIISRLDRVFENLGCVPTAWRSIIRRPVVVTNSQCQLRCTSYWRIFTESDCHWDIVSKIQKVVLYAIFTGYRHGAYRRWRSVVFERGACIYRSCIAGGIGNIGPQCVIVSVSQGI